MPEPHQQPQASNPLLPKAVDQFEVITKTAEQDFTISSSSKKLAQLEADHKFTDSQRGESYKETIHNIVSILIWVVGIIMMGLIIVRGIHLAIPLKFRWLGESDLSNIDRVIFSSIIVSLASKYFKKYKILGTE